jgi:hypothetical protein
MIRFFNSILETGNAALNCQAFDSVLEASTQEIDGIQRTLRVTATNRQLRSEGYRFYRHVFKSRVQLGDFEGVGYGEADSKILAYQKSIAEAVERAVYQNLKAKTQSNSSNGWAAHIDEQKAKHAASMELMERDAVLVHFMKQQPMVTLDSRTCPTWLKRWLNDEFRLNPDFTIMKILVSHLGFVPSVTAMLLTPDGHGVCSHATSDSLDNAIRSALAETLRIGEISAKRIAQSNHTLKTPMDHALHYAHHDQFPMWIVGEQVSFTKANESWNERIRNYKRSPLEFTYLATKIGQLHVVKAKSSQIQDLFFGTVNDLRNTKYLNLNRLNRPLEKLNQQPHFVA